MAVFVVAGVAVVADILFRFMLEPERCLIMSHCAADMSIILRSSRGV